MARSTKEAIKKIPIVGDLTRRVYNCLHWCNIWRIRLGRKKLKPFSGSATYWKQRYASGGNSGAGSCGKCAEFKAKVINSFVAEYGVKSVIEFGCGDGNQLKLMHYSSYLGFDVSDIAMYKCRQLFGSDATKDFRLMKQYNNEKAELTLSLDVIYHLVEKEIFENYMKTLFSASNRYVIIYSSDSDDNRGYKGTYIRHRKFTKWIQEQLPTWELIKHIPNKYPYTGDYRISSFADFYIYEKS